MKTLSEFQYNGERALEALFQDSAYGSIEQAIASLTLFPHPTTVAQTKNQALFRIRRYKANEQRGQVIQSERVVLCDNYSPTRAFLWANDLSGNDFKEVQFNHIYQKSYDPDFYTSLANVCVTPAFLSKLTDKNHRVIQLLKFRVYQEFDFLPAGEPVPEEPKGYRSLRWASYLKPCSAIRQRIEDRLAKNKASRIASSVRQFGWLLNEHDSL